MKNNSNTLAEAELATVNSGAEVSTNPRVAAMALEKISSQASPEMLRDFIDTFFAEEYMHVRNAMIDYLIALSRDLKALKKSSAFVNFTLGTIQAMPEIKNE